MTAPARPSAGCRSLLLELSRYLDGELTPASHLTVQRHIKACGCCAAVAARLRQTMAACRAEGRTRLPLDVRSRAAARIRALVAGPGRPPLAAAPRRRGASGTPRR